MCMLEVAVDVGQFSYLYCRRLDSCMNFVPETDAIGYTDITVRMRPRSSYGRVFLSQDNQI